MPDLIRHPDSQNLVITIDSGSVIPDPIRDRNDKNRKCLVLLIAAQPETAGGLTGRLPCLKGSYLKWIVSSPGSISVLLTVPLQSRLGGIWMATNTARFKVPGEG
jgi:hypothetical protein